MTSQQYADNWNASSGNDADSYDKGTLYDVFLEDINASIRHIQCTY